MGFYILKKWQILMQFLLFISSTTNILILKSGQRNNFIRNLVLDTFVSLPKAKKMCVPSEWITYIALMPRLKEHF